MIVALLMLVAVLQIAILVMLLAQRAWIVKEIGWMRIVLTQLAQREALEDLFRAKMKERLERLRDGGGRALLQDALKRRADKAAQK